MLKTIAMCLALGVAGCVLAAALKWAGAFEIPIEFLYDFYEKSPFFERIHGIAEMPARQIGILIFVATATALAVASIPHFARRLVIVLGAVLIVFFLSPVLALAGWKLEPFSWMVGILSAAASALTVFPGRPMEPETENEEPVELEEAKPIAKKGTKKEVALPIRTPEMALARAEQAAVRQNVQREEGEEDQEVVGSNEEPDPEVLDTHHKAAVLVCAVFPDGDNEIDGYVGKARAFLERARTFLGSVGASKIEVGPDFIRAVFLPVKGVEQANQYVVTMIEAAQLLRGHLAEYCNSIEEDQGRRLQFGVATEAFIWDAVSSEVPTVARDFVRMLCSRGRRFRAQTVMGSHAHRLMGGRFEVRPLELVDDPLSGVPAELYELLGAKGAIADAAMTRRDAFWEGVIFLRSGRNEEALECFDKASDDAGDDPVLRHFQALARGEELPDDDSKSAATVGVQDEEDDDVIPPVFVRESDSVDGMEMFVDLEEDERDAPSVPERS